MTGTRYSFRVGEPPIAKARPRVSGAGAVYTPARTRKYEAAVAVAAKAAGVTLQENRAYAVDIELSKNDAVVRIVDVGELVNTLRGDVDNYCKSILDGIGALPGWDDRQVVEVKVVKEWR